jgi:hypothetical protein
MKVVGDNDNYQLMGVTLEELRIIFWSLNEYRDHGKFSIKAKHLAEEILIRKLKYIDEDIFKQEDIEKIKARNKARLEELSGAVPFSTQRLGL